MCDQGSERRKGHEDHGDSRGGGPPDSDFLDLEIRKVLLAEAEGVTREAFRELLKESAKRHWRAKWGEQIDRLAGFAVDELLADMAANLEIEAKIAARAGAKKDRAEQIEALFADPIEAASEGEP